MKKLLLFFLAGFLLCSCSKNGPVVKIGIDPSCSGIDLCKQQKNVAGFIEELLFEICQKENIKVQLVKVNSFELLPRLENREFDLALTYLYPFDFNLAKYAFSSLALLTGSVLVVRENEPLQELAGKFIGVVYEKDVDLLMQQYPAAVYKKYFSAPELLDHVQSGFLNGGVLANLEAVPFVKNIYAGLKIQKPLTDFGLRFVCLKKQKDKLEIFDDMLQEKEKTDRLKAKWGLL